MWFDIGDQVKVRMPDGVLMKGVIRSLSFNRAQVYEYGVEVESWPGLQYYKKEYLIKDNPSMTYGFNCTCGSKATNQPGHSIWCNQYRKV